MAATRTSFPPTDRHWGNPWRIVRQSSCVRVASERSINPDHMRDIRCWSRQAATRASATSRVASERPRRAGLLRADRLRRDPPVPAPDLRADAVEHVLLELAEARAALQVFGAVERQVHLDLVCDRAGGGREDVDLVREVDR